MGSSVLDSVHISRPPVPRFFICQTKAIITRSLFSCLFLGLAKFSHLLAVVRGQPLLAILIHTFDYILLLPISDPSLLITAEGASGLLVTLG